MTHPAAASRCGLAIWHYPALPTSLTAAKDLSAVRREANPLSRLAPILALALLAGVNCGLTRGAEPGLPNDPPDKPKAAAKIEGPARKAAPPPAPVAADTPLVMDATQLCVFSASIPCRVFTSPDGIVSVKQSGPITIFARFVNGDPEGEERTYDKPHVWRLRATGQGLVEVLIVPDDPKESVLRQLIQIGPRPPPIPPGPTPGPTPVPVTGFRVAFIYEKQANLDREQLHIVNSTIIRDYLNRKTAPTDGGKGYRFWDKDIKVENETPTWKTLWEATRPTLGALPAVLIVNDQKGQLYPWPATEAEMLAFLKKFGGE